jgi:hypothetical protein
MPQQSANLLQVPFRLLLEHHLVELAELELHFPLVPLFQKLIDLVPAGVVEGVVHSEVAEDRLHARLHPQFSVTVDHIVAVVGHASDADVGAPAFLLEQRVAGIPAHGHKQSSLVQGFLVGVESGVEAGDDGMLGLDDGEQFIDVVNVHMEVVFVARVVFVEQGSAFDFGAGVSLDMGDQDFFGFFVVEEDVFVEEGAGVGD